MAEEAPNPCVPPKPPRLSRGGDQPPAALDAPSSPPEGSRAPLEETAGTTGPVKESAVEPVMGGQGRGEDKAAADPPAGATSEAGPAASTPGEETSAPEQMGQVPGMATDDQGALDEPSVEGTTPPASHQEGGSVPEEGESVPEEGQSVPEEVRSVPEEGGSVTEEGGSVSEEDGSVPKSKISDGAIKDAKPIEIPASDTSVPPESENKPKSLKDRLKFWNRSPSKESLGCRPGVPCRLLCSLGKGHGLCGLCTSSLALYAPPSRWLSYDLLIS